MGTTTFPPLNLPPLQEPLHIRDGEVRCRVRRRFVKLEPEEWVRQNMLGYLIEALGFPAGAIAVEFPLILNGMRRRADILCQTPNGSPLLLVECKAPEVRLSQAALDQVWRYGLALKTLPPVIVLTNGLHHQAFGTHLGPDPIPLTSLPHFDELRRSTGQMP